MKVTKMGNMVVYDFNYGQQVFTVGSDTILYVGDWEDDNCVWHSVKK